jgi:hypothetical protein
MAVMDKETAGKEAAREIHKETEEALQRNNATPDFIIKNLMRLATYKGEKPFSFQGVLVYSKELDYPEVQRSATMDLAQMSRMLPDRNINLTSEIIEKRSPEELTVLRDIVQGVTEALRRGQNVQKDEIDKKSE